MSASVFRGRAAYGQNDPIPMISILEDPRDMPTEMASESTSQTMLSRWNLLLQGWVKDDPENPTDPTYPLAADAVLALTRLRKDKRNILGFGGIVPCVMDVNVGSPICRPADNFVSDKAYFWLPVTLVLTEDAQKAFT